MEDNTNTQSKPVIPFNDFGWRWATTGISSKLNLPVSLFAVLDAILINGNGAYNKTEEFKKTIKTICINKYEIDDENLVETLTREKNPSEAKNIIENSGNYWKHLDLINPSGQNAKVTELGRLFLTGQVSKDEFITNLIYNYKFPSPIYTPQEVKNFELNGIEIFPFKIILEVFEELNLRNIEDDFKYLSEEDLKRIIVPFSVKYNSDLTKELVDHILRNRIKPLDYIDWPNCYSHYGDDKGERMLNEFLFFLEAFEFLKSNLGIKTVRSKSKQYFASEKLENLFLNDSQNYKSETEVNDSNKEIFENYSDILTAIQTKPFILLAGISGTGKSRLVRSLAFNSCNHHELRMDSNKPGNYELITVKPNWHDSSEIIGYISRINGEKHVVTDFLKFIVKAWHYPGTPFFLCFDEMNLAPVEQYFAEYLSIIETRSSKEGKVESDALLSYESLNFINKDGENIYEELLKNLGIEKHTDLWNQFISKGIQIPSNLVIMGTVNMDETTHSFSRKVLDRAMTFEMNDIDLRGGLEMNKNELVYPNTDAYLPFETIIGNVTRGAEVFNKYEDSEKVLMFLESINEILDASPFKIAYRVRDEFLIYCFHNHIKQGNINDALDSLTCMKILSRIEGDENKTEEILRKLKALFTEKEFIKKSLPKIDEMTKRLSYGYTSFWT